MDDRPNQVEEIVRTTPLPITPRNVHSIHTAGPAAMFAQFRATNNSNKSQTPSPVKMTRHGRSKSLTEGGAKSDVFVSDQRSNNNTPLDETASTALEPHTLAVATPDSLTPSTSPRMVVRVPPNTPSRSPGQELRSRVTELEQESRDLNDKCAALTRENERLSSELLNGLGKTEAEQLLQTVDDMTTKLSAKEEELRVLNIELKEKSKQLTELTNELAPHTSVTDLKSRVTELEKNSEELNSSLREARSELEFVQHELEAANDTATDLSKQVEERDNTIAGLHSNATDLAAEIERWKAVAQEIGPVQEENESLQKQLQTQRERAEQLEHERDNATNQNTALHGQVTDLDSELTRVRDELSRATAAKSVASEQHQHYESLLLEVKELRMACADLEELRKEVARKDEQLTRVKGKAAALEEERLKLHDQLKISEVTVERLNEQLTRGDKSIRQRVTQLESELKHVTEARDQIAEQLATHRDRVTALDTELKTAQSRAEQLAEQLTREQSSASKVREELQHVTRDHTTRASELTKQLAELTKSRDTFRDSAKKLEQQLDTAQKSATSAAEKHKSEVTALRDELSRASTSLKQYQSEANKQPASLVPPHADVMTELKARSELIKQHVTKLHTHTAVPGKVSPISALVTVLLIALALVLGLAVVSRDHFNRLVLYAQQHLPK